MAKEKMNALTWKEYEAQPERFWKGKEVVALEPLENGWASLPPGTVFTIERKLKGFSLVSAHCATCLLRVRMTRVNPTKLALRKLSAERCKTCRKKYDLGHPMVGVIPEVCGACADDVAQAANDCRED